MQDKKGSGDSADPFADIEAKILEEAERWKKGTFTVTRDVYEKDEALSAAVEQAIWVSILSCFSDTRLDGMYLFKINLF